MIRCYVKALHGEKVTGLKPYGKNLSMLRNGVAQAEFDTRVILTT